MEENIDSKYEFNAPKYMDFLQGDVDQDADKWFDERDGDEGGIDIEMAEYYEEALEVNGGFKNATSAITAALQENQEPVLSNNTVEKPALCNDKVTKVEDVVEMMEEDEPHTDDNDAKENVPPPPQEPTTIEHEETELEQVPPTNSDTKRVQNCPQEEFHSESTSEVSEAVTTSEEQSSNDKPSALEIVPTVSNPSIKPKRSNIRRSWKSPNVKVETPSRSLARRSCATKPVDYCDTKKRKKTLSEDNAVLSKKYKPEVKLTTAETPQFIRKLRERGIKRGPSSEAMQLNQIRQLQRQTRENVKKNEKIMNKALKAGPYVPVKSSEVTRPIEFKFESDKRIKTHGMHTRSESGSKTFQSQLRQHPPSPTFKKEITKPKPFNFTKSGSSAAPKQKWQSMAQFTMNYQTKTPERFRAKPKVQEGNKSLDGEKKHNKPQLTMAKTPLLMTKKRSRPITQESSHQIEEKTVEEMKQYKFKATEFDRRIIEKQGMFGVKKIPETARTSVKPFNFGIEARIDQRKQQKTETEKPLSTSTCAIKTTDHPKANLSTGSITNKGEAPRPRKTEVKPFSFESRDKDRYHKKEDKIKGIVQQEEKMHEFHARPLPSFSPDSLPSVRPKESTLPEPFQISSGSMTYKQKYQQQLKEKEEDEKAQREFRAKDAVVTKREPFKPLQGLIPTTNVKNVVLNSDLRAKERAKFEEWKHEQERQVEEDKLRFQKEKELAEMEAVRQLRKEAVPKAHPVRRFKAVEIHKSERPLTEPQTPNFECKKRAASKK